MNNVVLALALTLTVADTTKAEPVEVNRVAPKDEQVCHLDQTIVLIRCVRGTFIGCEYGGEEYSCKDGWPIPMKLIQSLITPKVINHTIPQRTHKTIQSKSLLDLLFHKEKK